MLFLGISSVLLGLLLLLQHSYSADIKPLMIASSNRSEVLGSGALIFIGEKDRRKFYVVNVGATWMESLELCHDKSLSFAALVNQDELNFLGLKLRQRSDWLYPWFWTCGHDFFNEGEYKWMSNNNRINPRFLTSQFSEVPARTKNCVQLSIRPTNRNVLFDFSCDDKTALPLCQGY